MSELVRDNGIVLRSIPFSETSTILTVFTFSHGVAGLMAKGARRKVKNGTALVLEPGYEVEVVWSHKQSRELQVVRELSLVNPHFGIRHSLEATVIASTVIELLRKTQNEDDPHPELFHAASRLLTLCESQATARWPVFWCFYFILLAQLGFAINESIDDIKSPVKLSGESIAVLRKLQSSGFDVAARLRTSATAEREITRWLSHYLSNHLNSVAQPRSLDALRWARPLSAKHVI